MNLWLKVKKVILESLTERSRKRHMRFQRHLQQVRLTLGEVDPAVAIEAELGQLLQDLALDDDDDVEALPMMEEDELPPPGGYLH